MTHRISWQILRGPIPDGLDACHKCDNPGCVNPDHLFLGTAADNMRDMMVKGRRAGNTKLGFEVAEKIRAERAGGASLKTLSKKYNVSKPHIWGICNDAFWRSKVS